MHFSHGVIIYVLFYHHAVISRGSLLIRETLLNEDKILPKFFSECKSRLEKHNLRHVAILGASDDQIDQTKSLLEAFPHIVGTDAKKFCASRDFGPNTLIVYFLASLEEECLKKVVGSLFRCKKNRIYFVFEGIEVGYVDIGLLLRFASENISERAIFINDRKKSLKLYGHEITADCSRKVALLVDWMPGVDLERLDDLAGRFIRNECPISIGTMNHLPWINVAEDAKGAMKIVGGSEGRIISTIAQKMNFTPLMKTFQISDEVKNHKTIQVVSSSADKNTAISIAQIRPTENVIEVVDITQVYAYECIVWCVPRIIQWQDDITICEFSSTTWVLIGLTFLATFTVEKIVRNTHHSNKENENKSESCSLILDLIELTIGNPIVYHPFSIGGKVLLIVYLCYSTIITTAYKTSLSSLLTVENSESSIIDVEGIIKANFTTGGDIYRLAILEDQIGENELIPELIKRYVIEPNMTKALRQISYEKNFAYLTPLSSLIYHENLLAKAGEPMSFEVLDAYVLTHGIVMVFPKSSHLTDRINQITLCLIESGLINYWTKSHTKRSPIYSNSAKYLKLMTRQEELYEHTWYKLYQVFCTYCIALAFCTFTFLGELIFHKFRFSSKVQRFRHSERSKAGRFTPLLSTS